VKAAELCRGVEALLSFYTSAIVCKVMLWFADDLQIFGWPQLLLPQHCTGSLETLRSSSPWSVQGWLLPAPACAWTSVWPHHSSPRPSRKLRFLNKMVQSCCCRVTVYGALCMFSDLCISPGWQVQSSPGPHIVASFSWVFMGDNCWERRGQAVISAHRAGEWGVGETLL